MSLHKLTAGSGYDYLTRQVAAMDATDKGHTGLASYYTEKGETPGVWLGSGMEGIEGLDAGDVVTADHMQSLFGSGHHPLATQRTEELDLRIGRDDAGHPTQADYKAAVRLGTPYKVYENDVSPFRIEVAKRIAALNEAAGLPGDWPVPAADRAKIRTEVAAEFFRTEHGRDPADARRGRRPHRHAVVVERTELGDQTGRVIFLAHGAAARNENGVRPGRLERRSDALRPVGQNLVGQDLATVARDQRCEHRRVRIRDARTLGPRARWQQLVSRDHELHARPPHDLHLCAPDGRERADVLRSQTPARAEHAFTGERGQRTRPRLRDAELDDIDLADGTTRQSRVEFVGERLHLR